MIILLNDNRKPVSYKITKQQVEYALILLKNNEQITMLELSKQIKKKYKDFNVTPQWLGKVLRDNNKTRKRTRHEHFPTTKYNKPVNKKIYNYNKNRTKKLKNYK